MRKENQEVEESFVDRRSFFQTKNVPKLAENEVE